MFILYKLSFLEDKNCAFEKEQKLKIKRQGTCWKTGKKQE
jgi:hypothetical protein